MLPMRPAAFTLSGGPRAGAATVGFHPHSPATYPKPLSGGALYRKEKYVRQKKGVALIARVWLIRGAYRGDPIWKRQFPPRV
jgi:hypothetical protein